MGSRDGGDRDPGHARDSRRALGPVISIIALLFLAQLYFGAWLPGRLSHPGMSVERILEFTYSTQEAIAGADPMRTGIAALKFGATLMIIPFSFAYVPELLLIGTPVEIAHAATAYLLGNLALAMGLQGAAFVHGLIAPWRRALFFAAFCLMFPTSLIMDALGLVLMALAWSGALLVPLVRRTAAGLGQGPPP